MSKEDQEPTEFVSHVFGMEVANLHQCATQILTRPDLYDSDLRDAAHRYLLDLFTRSTKGSLN